MLYELIVSGFGKSEDYNCAEKILYGANQAYALHLNENALKMSAGFGGGMGIESVCGVLASAVMVLSLLHVKSVAHASDIKKLETLYFDRFAEQFQTLDCKTLKQNYRTEEKGCSVIVAGAAKLLDEIILDNGLLS